MPSSTDELPVGRIAGLFGIRGELKCDPTSAGRTLFAERARFRAQLADGSSHDVRLASVREHKGRLLVRLQQVETANDAQRFVGAMFFAERTRIKLEAGEYLDADLTGCVLVDPDGKTLGTVSRVEHYPSSDMLVVSGNLVPMVRAFIRSIDVAHKRIVAELPPGLLDSTQADEA